LAIYVITISIFLVYLLAESYLHSKRLGRIQLRISVSGTRGKTSIVRMLASVCRMEGMNVLAKTTGSEASYILPDGSEEKIGRHGVTSVIEQKRLIRKGAQLGVDCIITETMSINPENRYAESHMLVRPDLTILSNIRADHLDVVDDDPVELSSLHLNDLCPGSKVFIPEGEINDFLRAGIGKSGSLLNTVEENYAVKLGVKSSIYGSMFKQNIDLVSAVASSLSIGLDTINEGLKAARMDVGAAAVYMFEYGLKRVYFVNSFAANDPFSTMELVKMVLASLSNNITSVYGYMSLRADRGERSKQWLEFLSGSTEEPFKHIFFSGLHARILKNRIRDSSIIRSEDPAKITSVILSEIENNSVVFGLANIHGRGLKLVKYWREKGIKIELDGI